MPFTTDELTQLGEVFRDALQPVTKAFNPPATDERPAQSAKGSNVNLRRYNPFPSLYKAMRGAYKGWDDSSAYERDFREAAKEALGYTGQNNDLESPTSVIWPTTRQEAIQVFDLMSEKGASKAMDRVDGAIKAMTESLTVSVSGGTAGGILNAPEFAQSLFAYALSPRVAVRNVPGIRRYAAQGNLVYFPRETTRAGASQANEAGTLSSADATLAQQNVTVQKQYAFRRWSSELAADARPAFNEFLQNTVIRDLDIQCDIQYLRGSGSAPQITGILNYSGLTSGPSLGANGRSPKSDDILDAVYNLEAVNATADFIICHPRTINSLRKEKDNEGRYLLSYTPVALGADGAPQPRPVLAGYLPAYTTTNLTITETTGANTDTSTLIIGDSSQIYLVERPGTELAFSEHLYFNTDELAVRAIRRSTIVIIQPTAVELVTGVRA